MHLLQKKAIKKVKSRRTKLKAGIFFFFFEISLTTLKRQTKLRKQV